MPQPLARPVVVQKYGGSSLGDTAALQRVAAQIAERHRRGAAVVVVVSAMGRATDQLLAQAQALTCTPPQRELDMLLSAGERISMTLLSMAIAQLGVPAISFTGSQSGIITDSCHQAARILEVRPARIEAALAQGKVVICAGYQGVSRCREVTTLGRGGSDTTAVALSAALGAEACEIYSDVDGVFSADPRLCPQARLLARLAPQAMQTLANAGAKVLSAEAVNFARAAGIRLLARHRDGGPGRQTQIEPACAAPQPGVLAVVATELGLCVRGAAQAPALPAAARPLLQTHRAAYSDFAPLGSAAAVALQGALLAARAAHMRARRVALVGVVGSDLLGRGGTALRAFLATGAVPLRRCGGNDSYLLFAVAEGQCAVATRALHDACAAAPATAAPPAAALPIGA